MPGKSLNDDERRLVNFWSDPPQQFAQPLLKSIAVQGPPALRGVNSISVPFDYPITAICGRNGVGKSTLLALAAFSANKPADWSVPNWPTSPTRKQPKSSAYTWTDFFFARQGGPIHDGLTISYSYMISGNDFQISRRRVNGRWKTLPDPGRSRPASFPVRPVEFVSLARVLPSAELHYVRKHFRTTPDGPEIVLNPSMLSAARSIFGRQFERVSVRFHGGVSLATCETDGQHYTGFDMGAGESAVISILARLQNLPHGGLLLIEEIEHGLHLEAQSRLVDALTTEVLRNKKQVVFTTHSAEIIDRLPREGRLLVQRAGDEHSIVSKPTTRFSTYAMSGIAHPEATIFVEDNFARELVLLSLPANARLRVSVLPIGDKSKVAAQLGAHSRAMGTGPAICIFDGDCTDQEIRGWMRREELPEDGSNYIRLPGDGLPPEIWTLNALREEPFKSAFGLGIGMNDADVTRLLDDLTVLPDHHQTTRELALRTGLTEDQSGRELVRVLAPTHNDLEAVRTRVAQLLG